MKKLYKLDMTDIKSLNVAHLNPTMKAIVKTMYRIEKSDEYPNGLTGDRILEIAVETGLWSTTQEPSKYHTTWAYYVKKLKEEYRVLEVGTIQDSNVEYLE